MKILFLITGLGVGGAERQIVDLADRLFDRGHTIRICYLTGEARTLPQNASIQVVSLGMKKSVLGFAKTQLRLRREISMFRPDVVHSHMVHANLMARLLRLTTRIPRLICTAHNTNEGGRLRMWAYRITDFLADMTTNVSEEAVAAFVARGAVKPGRMKVVFNGIDTDRFHKDRLARKSLRESEGIGDSEKVVLAVGRLMEAKDYPNLLVAYSNIYRQSTNLWLWIVGEGSLHADLLRRAEELGVSDRVRFKGLRRDIPELMNAADVFVLSSAWEGFGLVVAEAMACECVVVATDSGGVKEVLGNCGFLAPPRDSSALADALQRALALPTEQARSLGQRARERVVSMYSLESAVGTWERIYSQPSPSSHRNVS